MTSDATQTPMDRDAVQVTTDSGASARILPYGAHLLSWRPAHNPREHLFLSDKAIYEPGQAIRGGVPVIFPQFAGRGPLPKHGFARVSAWRLVRSGPVDGNRSEAVFELASNEQSQQLWPHAFVATYTVTLSDNQLDMQLDIANTGNDTFSFTAGLHTYLAIGDLRATKLTGLTGSDYQDDGVGELQPERRETMTFAGHIDRVYHKTASPLRLKSPVQTTRIQAKGFADTVVWNPGPELAAGMKDMADGEHAAMLCVESAAVAEPVELSPQAIWTGRQTLASE